MAHFGQREKCIILSEKKRPLVKARMSWYFKSKTKQRICKLGALLNVSGFSHSCYVHKVKQNVWSIVFVCTAQLGGKSSEVFCLWKFCDKILMKSFFQKSRNELWKCKYDFGKNLTLYILVVHTLEFRIDDSSE